jgi:hypothetical protein
MVQVSGSANDMSHLGRLIEKIEDRVEWNFCASKDEYFPVNLRTFIIVVNSSENDRLTVDVGNNSISFTGSRVAISDLGRSLINFFSESVSVDDHFEFFYYDGNPVLNKTECHLVFLCDR